MSDLSVAEVVAMLAPAFDRPLAQSDSAVDSSELLVEAFLRAASAKGPVRCSGRIEGKVEFRAGEGPLFELGAGPVVIETNWADALFTWFSGSGHETAAMPLDSLSRYIAQGSVVLGS